MGAAISGPRLTVEQVRLRRGGRDVLRGVSFDLAGGLTGVLGLNGAGKTSLIRTVVGVAPPDAGAVRLDGSDPYVPAQRADFLARVGYVPQGFEIAAGMRVGDYLTYMAYLKGIERRRREEAVATVLAQVGLADRRASRGRELSGGMVRRVGIAQALLGAPRVLVLDEPTAGLDPHQRDVLRELVDRLAHDSAVLLATHLVDDLAGPATRVVVLDAGEAVFDGSAEELALEAGADADDGRARHGTPVERGFLALVRGR